MIAWAVEVVGYAALAIWATWISRQHSAALVGLTLILCCAVTNAAYFGSSFPSRLTLEAIQAITLINSARMAFKASRTVGPVVVVALSAADLAFVVLVGFGYIHPRGPGLVGFIYGDVTNAIFAAQCLLVAAPGVRDAILGRDAGRPARGLVGGGRAAVHDRRVTERRP